MDTELLGETIIKSEENIKKENQLLKNTLTHMKAELDRLRQPPLVVAEIKSIHRNKAIIKLSNGNAFWVNISNNLMDKLEPLDQVLVEQKTLNIIDKLDKRKNMEPEHYLIQKKPDTSFKHIGGLEGEINLIKEVIELPLNNPELFKKIGITPPKGILLHGPPGCGKTMLAKAVANSTNATFIHVVGSELVQKFIGEGAKLVKEMFQLAREKSPSILFIDEIDALAATRLDIGTSGEREVQRTFMQLLSELDGFKELDNVKIIAATNRMDILDSAILRPGRLDRLIEVQYPNSKTREKILRVHLKNIQKSRLKIKELVELTEDCSGAEIASICTEAGYHAIRENRDTITQQDMINAINQVKSEEEIDDSHLTMFG